MRKTMNAMENTTWISCSAIDVTEVVYEYTRQDLSSNCSNGSNKLGGTEFLFVFPIFGVKEAEDEQEFFARVSGRYC